MFALVVRDIRDQFRLERLRVVVGPAVFTALLAVLFFVNFQFNSDKTAGFRSFFFQVYAVQVFLLVVVGSLMAAGSVSHRRERLEMDFELLVPRGALSIASGFLFGSNVLVYFLFLLSVPFALLGFLLGGLDPIFVGKLYLYLFAACSFFESLAFFGSTVSRSSASSYVFAVLFLFIFGAASLLHGTTEPVLAKLPAFSPAYPLLLAWTGEGSAYNTFYGIPSVDLLLIAAGVFLFAAFWLFTASCRKLTEPARPALSKPQTLVMYTLAIAIFGGLAWERMPSLPEGVSLADVPLKSFFSPVLLYLVFMLGMIIASAMVVTPARAFYQACRKEGAKSILKSVFAEGSLSFSFTLALFLVGLAYFAVAYLWPGGMGKFMAVNPSQGPVLWVSVLMGFVVVFVVASLYIAILQTVQLLSGRYGKSLAVLSYLVLVVVPFVLDYMGVRGTVAPGGFSYVYFINPLAAVYQVFPNLGLEIANPMYIFKCGSSPSALITQGGVRLWLAVATIIYLLATLILWGLVLMLRKSCEPPKGEASSPRKSPKPAPVTSPEKDEQTQETAYEEKTDTEELTDV